MGRELIDYRPNLERLNELFPDKEMLTVSDVMRVYGAKNPRSLTVKFIGEGYRRRVSKASLARQMSGGDS